MRGMEQTIADFIDKYGIGLYIPSVHITDIIEVLILTFLIYQIIIWIKNTKAWMLLRGIIVLAGFILLAAIFKMHTILFIARNSLTVMATAAIVVFQPELRRALEKLGEKQFLTSVVPFEQNREIRFSEETREDIIRACFAMGKVKTGALIVVEQAIRLTEYESTGIQMDCLVSSQVLINIFEHNTPLHDLLDATNILLVPGSGFDWKDPDHFRIVMLPQADVLSDAISRMGTFLDGYKQK